jgi:hypothetical protein
MIRPDHLTRRFRRLARMAGPSVIRFHDLRHSNASLALEAGVPLKSVSEPPRPQHDALDRGRLHASHAGGRIGRRRRDRETAATARPATGQRWQRRRHGTAGRQPTGHVGLRQSLIGQRLVSISKSPEGGQVIKVKAQVSSGVGPVGLEPTTRGLKGARYGVPWRSPRGLCAGQGRERVRGRPSSFALGRPGGCHRGCHGGRVDLLIRRSRPGVQVGVLS